MAGLFSRCLLTLLALTLAAAGSTAYTSSCPFCSMQGQTLIGDINQASMVLYGSIVNSKLDPSGVEGGSADLQIEAVIKNHEILGERKIITLPRYIPPSDKNTRWLVICDVFKGKIDPYQGHPLQADSDMVPYLKGALAVKDKPISARLRFYFDYLDNKDLQIANDAYKEFGNADYKDYRDMAKDLPADKIAKWLEDPNTPAFRYGLYASMLGHCGKDKHAELLRKMLDDAQKRQTTGIDGVLAGYIMLKPTEGMTYINNILKDSSKEFMLRYAGLRALRFFWDFRTDLANRDKLATSVGQLLDQSDIADLAIEDLRKWNRWEVCERIIGLAGKKSHDIPIVRRAILRYALSCPKPAAAEFVEKFRKTDPETVKDAEELLKLETGKPLK